MNYWKIAFLSLVVLLACSKDDKMDEVDELDCSETLTYTRDIKEIVDNNCAVSGCHDGSNSNPDFGNYSTLFGRRALVRSRVESGSMPPAGRPDLSQNTIDLISCWVETGAVE